MRRRTLTAAWPAPKLVGASAASVGWYHQFITTFSSALDIRCLKVLQQVQCKVLEVPFWGETWRWWNAGSHSWIGGRQLQVCFRIHQILAYCQVLLQFCSLWWMMTICVKLHILQISRIEGRPSILEKWSTKFPDQRQMLFLYDAVFQKWGAPLISGNLASQPPRPKKNAFLRG